MFVYGIDRKVAEARAAKWASTLQTIIAAMPQQHPEIQASVAFKKYAFYVGKETEYHFDVELEPISGSAAQQLDRLDVDPDSIFKPYLTQLIMTPVGSQLEWPSTSLSSSICSQPGEGLIFTTIQQQQDNETAPQFLAYASLDSTLNFSRKKAHHKSRSSNSNSKAYRQNTSSQSAQPVQPTNSNKTNTSKNSSTTAPTQNASQNQNKNKNKSSNQNQNAAEAEKKEKASFLVALGTISNQVTFVAFIKVKLLLSAQDKAEPETFINAALDPVWTGFGQLVQSDIIMDPTQLMRITNVDPKTPLSFAKWLNAKCAIYFHIDKLAGAQMSDVVLRDYWESGKGHVPVYSISSNSLVFADVLVSWLNSWNQFNSNATIEGELNNSPFNTTMLTVLLMGQTVAFSSMVYPVNAGVDGHYLVGTTDDDLLAIFYVNPDGDCLFFMCSLYAWPLVLETIDTIQTAYSNPNSLAQSSSSSSSSASSSSSPTSTVPTTQIAPNTQTIPTPPTNQTAPANQNIASGIQNKSTNQNTSTNQNKTVNQNTSTSQNKSTNSQVTPPTNTGSSPPAASTRCTCGIPQQASQRHDDCSSEDEDQNDNHLEYYRCED